MPEDLFPEILEDEEVKRPPEKLFELEEDEWAMIQEEIEGLFDKLGWDEDRRILFIFRETGVQELSMCDIESLRRLRDALSGLL